ncbi:hypothetical protein DYB32_004326 [Aphanomyces invadans]|uniref:Uncharacterized protein n=1 Tax=Aphanomyces invadans TaxID=157072 RepID=A0A418B3L0_9STRA|nr:hypothetical protein DYB32_004326 [Aphanomyces invadans]
MGRKLRYDAGPPVAFEGDTGSAKKGKATRKTVKELSATFPAPTKVPLLRYAIDGNTVPEPLYVDDDSDAADLLRVLGDRVETEEMERLRRELRLGLVLHDGGGADATVPPTASDVAVGEGATWNTTIQSFDSLANDQRCWVREKSKVATEASLKDNPFEANVVQTIVFVCVTSSTSRVRNDNAVESVVKSLNSKHEKRLVQALIDSDQQVVEEEELLVRCADIRMQSKESLMDLARAKNEFVEAEIQWELHRRDPIELLRRKVQATACEGNEVMIGNQEFIYSAF